MQGAELRLPNGAPVTVLSYMGESKSVRQKAVYQCIGVGAVGTQYSGSNGQHLPFAITALKSLAVDVKTDQPAPLPPSQPSGPAPQGSSFGETYRRQQQEHMDIMRL
jgi:hypothetical protein